MPLTKVLIRAPQDRERRAAARMTGRYLLTIQQGAQEDVTAKLAETGLRAATPVQHAAASAHPLPRGEHLMLSHLGIAVIDAAPDQENALHTMAAQHDAVMALEPERIVRAVGQECVLEYVRGWRDAVDALRFLLDAPLAVPAPAPEPAGDTTWGLAATKAASSRFSGNGIRVAVLDTGVDLTHPDFAGRQIVTTNFVGDNVPFHDGVGHGTHCTGTVAGPLHPVTGPRYGIAYNAKIFVGRVLDDTGRGGDFNVIQGIDWVIAQGCDIVSLSLETPWLPGDPPYSQAYEAAAKRAMAAGCLIVVSAGNDAHDPQLVGAVGTPGNSPSALTVAAVDRTLATAPFSNRVQTAAPGVKGPDLAGPGVDVYSSWPVAGGQYNTISGTSMAAPHVAGIAALFAEANGGARGQALKDFLIDKCMALSDDWTRQGEIGRGLVQAPVDPSTSNSGRSIVRR
jgi:subtilisin family serine protease